MDDKPGVARALLGSALFFCVAPALVAGVVPWALTGWRLGPPLLGMPPLRAVGVGLVVLGLTGVLDCFARFALEGRGTPAPVAPTRQLVASGLYRFVRNPMYVGVVAAVIGQGLVFGSVRVLAYGAALWGAFHAFVVGYEEPTLLRQFGGSYLAYRAAVRRWRPRVTPWRQTTNRSE